jgi:hypothetical protein
MSRVKKISLALLLLFIAMQFIRPSLNRTNEQQEADLIKHLHVPADVAAILKTSCYDCHSNNTRYPWYTNVQPVGWLLAKHINEGKQDLNFDDFGNYSQRRRLSKMKATYNSIKDGSMPLSSYTLLHREAKLSKEKEELILAWAERAIDSLSGGNKIDNN